MDIEVQSDETWLNDSIRDKNYDVLCQLLFDGRVNNDKQEEVVEYMLRIAEETRDTTLASIASHYLKSLGMSNEIWDRYFEQHFRQFVHSFTTLDHQTVNLPDNAATNALIEAHIKCNNQQFIDGIIDAVSTFRKIQEEQRKGRVYSWMKMLLYNFFFLKKMEQIKKN
jgi:inorganic triphosphatase YgiF